MSLTTTMTVIQGAIGISIIIGTTILIASSTDKDSPLSHKLILTGLAVWGMWFTWLAFNQTPDSPPAIALSACVGYVLLSKNRQIQGLMNGESRWLKDYKSNHIRGR